MSTSPLRLVQLPLFPLQTVLFPDGLLPLRIFEVRYLDMVARCHKIGAPFGVVCINPSAPTPSRSAQGDGYLQETFFPVGTLANITELVRPQAGLIMIRSVGTQRFRIERCSQQKFGLWVADVELLDADPVVGVPDDLAHAREALKQLVHNIELSLTQSGEGGVALPIAQPYRWDDCGWLANRWCEMLPLNPELKHRFMSLDSSVLRLELVADTLGQLGFVNPA
jgi:uncharacterized protein